MTVPAMTAEELQALDSVEGKQQVIRDAVKGVVGQYHTGFFLHGEGGTSKSFTVLGELQALKATYVLHNSRLTGRGLVDALEQSPSEIHLIEDAETLLDDKKSFGPLRSALWSQSRKKPMEREVTWGAYGSQIRFVFTGGVIIISNKNFAQEIPEIRAIKTRINVLKVDYSGEEIKALMKKLCMEGYVYGDDYASPDECWAVGAFIAERLESLRRNIDLRLLINGFRDYLQWKAEMSRTHWQNLLLNRMAERVMYQTRGAVKGDQSKTALEINAMPITAKEKHALWKKKTGLSQAAFYRALRRAADPS